jgi:uncharacterized membrane protein
MDGLMSIYEATEVTDGLFFPDPYGLNSSNQMAGDSTQDGNAYTAYVDRSLGSPAPVNPPEGAVSASLRAINDAGVAVGTWRDGNGLSHAFMVDGNNNATDLSALIGGRQSWGADINNNGVIVGGVDFGDGTTSNSKGFTFNTNFRTLQIIDGLSDFPMCSPSAINDIGQIVGTCFDPSFLHSRPFLFALGSISKLFDQEAYAFDINNQGHVAGATQDFIASGGNAGPFLFADGKINWIPVNGLPNALNDNDQVVGNAMKTDLTSFAFIYDGGIAYDLNTLVTPPTPLQIILAWDINNSGAISTSALDSDFGGHALLLSPPPTVNYVPQSILGLVGTILFGVTQDGGGLIYFGRGPVPVDPWGWFSDNQLELAFQRATTIIQRQFVNDPASAQQALLQLQTFKATVQEKRKEKPGGNGDVGLNINVKTKGGGTFTGTVNIDCQHQTLSDHQEFRNVDASKTIAIKGLKRGPQGLYQVTVTPTRVFKPVSQFLNIPASGAITVEFVVETS